MQPLSGDTKLPPRKTTGWHATSTPAIAAHRSAALGRDSALSAHAAAAFAPKPGKRRDTNAQNAPKRIAEVKNSASTTPRPGHSFEGTARSHCTGTAISVAAPRLTRSTPSPASSTAPPPMARAPCMDRRLMTRSCSSTMRGSRISNNPDVSEVTNFMPPPSGAHTSANTVIWASDFRSATRPPGNAIMPP